MRSPRVLLLVVIAIVLAAALLPVAASACPLCKDAKADTDYAGGTASLPNGFYYSILFMVCAPFAVIGGLALRIARARRRLAGPEGAAAGARAAAGGDDGRVLLGAAGSQP